MNFVNYFGFFGFFGFWVPTSDVLECGPGPGLHSNTSGFGSPKPEKPEKAKK